MIYRIAQASAWRLRRTLSGLAKTAFAKGTLTKTAALTVALAVVPATLALAQQPAPKKPAAPAPAKPAQQQQPQQQQPAPQQQQSAQQEQVQLIYSPWTKFCVKRDEDAAKQDPAAKQDAGKQVCFTGKDARIESGMLVASAVLIEPEGAPKKIFRITVPLGMALANGTRVLIDQDQPLTAPFAVCIPAGCMADYEVGPELIANMKKGKGLYIQAIKATGQPITVPLPLADFGKAYDGPPTDPKQFEQQQQKLQEELQKRAEEARKKLEQTQPGAGASATPPGKTQ